MTNYHEKIPPDVRAQFEKLALHLINSGWAKYSADAILHRIRWHMRVERNIRDFKCNNNWTSHLARWFADKHPEHSEFFNYRELTSERGYDLDDPPPYPNLL